MCTDCGVDSCDCDLTVPKGDQGDPGAPSAAFFNFITSGAPLSNAVAAYVTAGEFVFDEATMEVFTQLKACIYMSAGTGSLKIRRKSDGSTLYENTNITATSTYNVETATGLSIIPANDEVVQIQFKTNNAANICFFSSITFGYE